MPWLTLLRFWPAALSATLTVGVCYFIFGLMLDRAELRHQVQVKAATEAVLAECRKNNQLTEEISNEYQTKVDDLTRRLAAAKRLRNGACIIPLSNTVSATGGNVAARPGYAGAHGVTADSLLDYAADAERHRLQLTGCQRFIRSLQK